MDSMEQALNDAVVKAGGQAALSRLIGVSQPSVWHWVNKSRRVAAEFTLKVEEATGVSRHRLRPDLYPPVADDTVLVCGVCDRRPDQPETRACTATDCGLRQRQAA